MADGSRQLQTLLDYALAVLEEPKLAEKARLTSEAWKLWGEKQLPVKEQKKVYASVQVQSRRRSTHVLARCLNDAIGVKNTSFSEFSIQQDQSPSKWLIRARQPNEERWVKRLSSGLVDRLIQLPCYNRGALQLAESP